MLNIFRGIALKIAPSATKLVPSASVISNSYFHTTSIQKKNDDDPTHFMSYNDIVYPPQSPDEEPRPAVRYDFFIPL